MKNKLQENMKRFGTKNLSEQTKGLDVLGAELMDGGDTETTLQNAIDALSAAGAGSIAGNAAAIVKMIEDLEKGGKIEKEMATVILSMIPLMKTPVHAMQFGVGVGKMGAQHVKSIADLLSKFIK